MGTGPEITGKLRAGFLRRAFTRRALGRAFRIITLPVFGFSVSFGFLAGARSSVAGYDPHLFASGVSFLLACSCGVMALLLYLNRVRRADVRRLRAENESLSDRSWELKEAEERARNFVAALGDLIVRRDQDGRITFANEAFCGLAGRGTSLLLGRTFAPPVLEQGDTATLPDGTRVHDQLIDGAAGPRWIAWRDVIVRTGAGGTEVQSVGRDVTDRVVAERALAEARDAADAANQAKSRFLAMVSHEIRTPLNGILGMADLLLETPLTPEQKTYAKAVRTSGDTLLSLIEEILDFSKIEAGKLDIEARPFALAALVEEVVELLAPRAQAKGLEIASYVDERLPGRVAGDAARLRQVLLNLLGNAVKFTEHGGVAVIAEPGVWEGEVAILVRDTGIGIAPEQQQRIFEDFEQVDSGTARRFSGTGLGLSISRRIVERMGGRIAVESMPGAGATFTITLPLATAEPMPETGFAPPDLAGRAVLIVAPSTVEASLLSLRLMRWGAQTCVVPDATVAAALLPERDWDTLMFDHALRAADTSALLSAAPAVRRRIALITPSTRHELAALQEAGCTGYLVKPVRAASLAARLAGPMPAAGGFADRESGVTDPTGAASTGALSILVAEDNEINALLARALLTRLGHRPTVATNGAAAVDVWHAARAGGAPYDLVLMDVHMPGTDGLEATRRIRAAEAETGTHTPVLAITANAFSEEREACLEAGMDGFLVKPLDRDRLAAALSDLAARGAPLAA
jgi:signal transduction histidine kinase/DNA-binding response OmpR family regulator